MGAHGRELTAVSTAARYMTALAALGFASAGVADPAAWRIVGQGGSEITLLGSMHVLRASDHPLPPSVDALIERAETVVMELDLDDIDAATQQRVILGAAMLPQGTELPDVLDAPLYRQLSERAAELNVDLALLARFEPWFLSVMLLDVGMRRYGFEAERGVEQYVLAQAQAGHKEIVGLETLEFQIGIFDALPASSQQMMLAQTLAELDEAETAMASMADAWRAGELEALSGELLDDFADFPGLYAALVTERNESWIESLERLLATGRRHLVVVGALHLVGEHNVVDLMTARGHRVTRLE
jgi:uncharacterized protein YbaP (TraB family)